MTKFSRGTTSVNNRRMSTISMNNSNSNHTTSSNNNNNNNKKNIFRNSITNTTSGTNNNDRIMNNSNNAIVDNMGISSSNHSTTTATNTNNKMDDSMNKNIIRKVCGSIVTNKYIQNILITFIIINSIMMGIATYDIIRTNALALYIFTIIDLLFLIVFTIELVFNIIYYGLYYCICIDNWILFDILIIICSWILNKFTIVRTLRIFKLVKQVQSLKTLINAVFDVIPRFSGIVLLLIILMYIYSVVCTTLFKEYYNLGYTDYDYFSRIDISLLTLLQMMTLDWTNIVRQINIYFIYSPVLFGTFLVFTGFILYSLIIAVVCDAVADNQQDNEKNNTNNEQKGNYNDNQRQDDTEITFEEQSSNTIVLQQRINDICTRISDITVQQTTLVKLITKLSSIDTTDKNLSLNNNDDNNNYYYYTLSNYYNHNKNNEIVSTTTIDEKQQQQSQKRRTVKILDEHTTSTSTTDIDSSSNTNVDNVQQQQQQQHTVTSTSTRPGLQSITTSTASSTRSLLQNNYTDTSFVKQQKRLLLVRQKIRERYL